MRWVVLIGINVIPRVINASGLGQLLPTGRSADVLVGFYVMFAFLTWTARPLFNLTLRLDKFGRYALSPRQIIASNWVGSTFLIALLGFVAWLFTRSMLAAILAGGFAFLTSHCRRDLFRQYARRPSADRGIDGFGRIDPERHCRVRNLRRKALAWAAAGRIAAWASVALNITCPSCSVPKAD